MDYEIQDDVPIPHGMCGRRTTPERVTIQKLALGQSFEAPAKFTRRMRNAAYFEGLGDRKYTVKKQPNGNVRVWRIR